MWDGLVPSMGTDGEAWFIHLFINNCSSLRQSWSQLRAIFPNDKSKYSNKDTNWQVCSLKRVIN